MKILANEMLFANKNLKFKGDSPETTAQTATALAEVPEEGDVVSALNAQSMNNVMFQGVNPAKIKKMGLGAMTALTLLGGTAALTSCQEEPDILIQNTTTVGVNINIKIKVDNSMKDSELLALILEELKGLRQDNKNLADINKAMLAELIKQGISMDRIMSLLEQMNMTAQDIFNLVKDNSEKQEQFFNNMSKDNKDFKQMLMQIFNSVNNGNKLSAENNKLLTAVLVQMGKSNQNDQVMIAILNKIMGKINESIQTNKAIAAKQDFFLKAILGKLDKLNNTMKHGILALLDKIDSVSEKNLDMLTGIFNAIQEGNENDKTTQGLLLAIYNKTQESIDKNQEMTEKTHELLWGVLGSIQGMNEDMKTGFSSVVNNLDKMTEENRAFYNKLLAKISKLDQNAQRALGTLIRQMATGNAISAEMLNKINAVLEKMEQAHQDDLAFYNQSIALMSELLSNVGKLGNKADAIINTISNITFDAKVDLTTIEKLLADILAQSKSNGEVLTSMDGKLNLVGITLEGVKTELERQGDDKTEANKAILAKLDQILAKIHAGCKCDASLQVIIEKLDKIVDEIKNGNVNEGILDDLDNMFN